MRNPKIKNYSTITGIQACQMNKKWIARDQWVNYTWTFFFLQSYRTKLVRSYVVPLKHSDKWNNLKRAWLSIFNLSGA